MAVYLVSGASGFFGSVLKKRLVVEGHQVVNIDLEEDADHIPGLTSIQGDIRDGATLRKIFSTHPIAGVFHCAAQLAHGAMDASLLWTSNVDGTRLLAQVASSFGVRPFVFLSSNCLWAENLGHAVQEDQDAPAPIELYGKSKLEGERIVQGMTGELDAVIIRCPTIMDGGRLGLLAILYEFIDDGKTVWVVGDGSNRYQFIYAEDLATACIKAIGYGNSDLFHIGSDDVKSMRAVYESVIRQAAKLPGSRAAQARVRSLPKGITVAAMKLAHALKISPLGPYHYKMIAESFIFDTSKIKRLLGWQPTMTNEEMMLRSYRYYSENRSEIHRRTNTSAHRKPASMGVIRALKWVS